jgi:hypothetical protein
MFVSDIWCRLSHSIPIVIILVSAFSIMMISIDRWMCVVYSRQRQLNCRDILIIISSIWVLSFSLAAPTFFNREKQENLIIDSMKDEFYKALSLSNFTNMILSNFTIENEQNISFDVSRVKILTIENLRNIYSENENVNLCVENWSYPYQKRIYVLILFGLEFFLPCLTMLVTYVWIIRFLNKHDQRMLNHEQMKNNVSTAKIKSRHQRNCLLLTSLCLAFIICSLPLSLFNILLDIFINLNWIQQKEKTIYWLIIVLTTLELMNIVVSPILYGYMNQNFRRELIKFNNDIRNKVSNNDIENGGDIPLNTKIFSKNY